MVEAAKIEDYRTHPRQRLGSNLRELEPRVRASDDWESYFRSHPRLAVGAALGGGALLAVLVVSAGSKRGGTHRLADRSPSSEQDEILSYWRQFKSASIAVAAERLVDFVDEAVPGFKQQMIKAGFA